MSITKNYDEKCKYFEFEEDTEYVELYTVCTHPENALGTCLLKICPLREDE